MLARCIIRISIAIVAVGYAIPLPAGEIGEFLSCMARDTKRRHCWPEPFVYPDREVVRQTLSIQVSAGWERQNLMSEFHFSPDGKQLTEAGRMRLQWIMSEVPDPHRQVFVHRADTPQETAVRMQTVRQFVAHSGYGSNTPVLESTRTDDGCAASRIDAVVRKAAAAALEPKLLGSASTGVAGSTGSH
jgi:hypothetical protein